MTGEPTLPQPQAVSIIDSAAPPTRFISRTPWQILWMKLRKNRAAMVALALLVVMYAAALFADVLAPYHYETLDQDHPFHPPMLTSVHVTDADGRLSWPFVYGVKVVNPSRKLYEEDTATRYPLRLFGHGDEHSLLWLFDTDRHFVTVDAPGKFYLLGSDQFGRDMLSRILYGSRVSLSVGIIGIAISTVLGMLVGGIAGYFGGATDFILMRIVELILALPSLYLILVLRQTFGSDLTSIQIYLLIVLILSFIGWASEARVIRGMVLSLKEQEYVVAAQALGFSKIWIIVKHILPNTLSFVIVTATLSVPFYILGEVALSYLGVGIQEPEASWGNMLRAAQNVSYLTDFSWVVIPGVFIFLAVIAWNVFGDGLRDAADPRTDR